MSWSIEGKVFIKDKCIFNANFDRLKNINMRGYGLDLMYVDQLSLSDEDKKNYNKSFEEDNMSDINYQVFNYSSFELALNDFQKDVEKNQKEYDKLMDLRYSKDYYSMSEDEKINLFDDIDIKKECLEDYQYQVESVKYILNVICLAADMYDPKNYEYHDIDDVRIVLYVE